MAEYNLPKSIRTLDLTMVKRKLMEPYPEGRDWTAEQCEQADLWYRRYLTLCMLHEDVPCVPNTPIDTIWHQHILDTAAYADDCDRIFGKFLHHFPYYGLRGDDDRQNRDNSFGETNALYREHFGEDCTIMHGFAEGTSCKGGGSGGGGGCSRNIGASCRGGGSGGGGGCSRNIAA